MLTHGLIVRMTLSRLSNGRPKVKENLEIYQLDIHFTTKTPVVNFNQFMAHLYQGLFAVIQKTSAKKWPYILIRRCMKQILIQSLFV